MPPINIAIADDHAPTLTKIASYINSRKKVQHKL